MRAYEFVTLNETTTAGSIATVTVPLGATQSRGLLSGKYTNSQYPNTPAEYRKKAHANRQFKNSIGQ